MAENHEHRSAGSQPDTGEDAGTPTAADATEREAVLESLCQAGEVLGRWTAVQATLVCIAVGTSIIGRVLPVGLALPGIAAAGLIRSMDDTPAGRFLATTVLSGTAGYIMGAIATKHWMGGWSSLLITIAALCGTAAVETQCRQAQARFKQLSQRNDRLKADEPDDSPGA